MLVMAQELYFLLLAFEVAFAQHTRQQMNIMLLVMRAWFWMALQALLETVQVVSLTIFIWE